jgi:hypothetical protein
MRRGRCEQCSKGTSPATDANNQPDDRRKHLWSVLIREYAFPIKLSNRFFDLTARSIATYPTPGEKLRRAVRFWLWR